MRWTRHPDVHGPPSTSTVPPPPFSSAEHLTSLTPVFAVNSTGPTFSPAERVALSSSRHRSACGSGLGSRVSGVPTSFRTCVRLHYRGCGMDERLRRVLRDRVEAYLRDVEGLLRGPAPAAAWPAVRNRLLPLATGWRSLLAQHGAGLRGRCRHCDRSFRPVRHRRPLCSVWRTAHAHLIGGWPSGGGE